MKKMFILPIALLFSITGVYASVEDNSIIEELSKENTKEISSETLEFQRFESCKELEDVTNDFLKDYSSRYNGYYGWGVVYRSFNNIDEWMVMEDSMELDTVTSSSKAAGSDFSNTNEQVSWVSESEIVKTDGEYIYYMSDFYDSSVTNYNDRQKKNVYIIEADSMKIVKKINLPKHFWGTQLYLEWDKLVILASWSPSWKFQKQYWDSSSKTYTIIYDVENPEEAKLVKAFMTEWSFSKSRLIDDKLYVISRKDNYSLFRAYSEDNEINAEDIIPKGLEITSTDNEDEKNVEIWGVKKDYKVNTGYVSKCNSIEYILPESETDLGYPQFNLISIIDIEDIEKEVNTKVVFWNLNEIYMSLDNLYMTNSVYKTEAFRCPANAKCIMPYYYGWTNHTLIHKMNIVEDDLEYQTSALIEWSPLTQYSMDEYKEDFRILTKTSRWNSNWEDSHTDLYVLDKNLEVKSSLENLWAWEDFKSSRYMWDKLFLVTFQQIDPLFVIDLEDSKNPKILGELKMPGYSTYLHPYDENHIIGIGYDTKENKWGWVQNNGVKVDLYEIDYDRKPESKDNKGDIYVAQKYTKTFGEYGSYSEALNNPRMFQWKKSDNDLFLPMTLKKNDSEDQYRAIDFFQWLVSINIDKNNWIKENYRVTHLDTEGLEKERIEECSKYTTEQTDDKCVTLLNWEEYCQAKRYTYVPKYCYEKSPIGEYLSNKSWNYSNMFVKRSVWIWDELYTISDKEIQKSDIDNWKYKISVKLK